MGDEDGDDQRRRVSLRSEVEDRTWPTPLARDAPRTSQGSPKMSARQRRHHAEAVPLTALVAVMLLVIIVLSLVTLGYFVGASIFVGAVLGGGAGLWAKRAG